MNPRARFTDALHVGTMYKTKMHSVPTEFSGVTAGMVVQGIVLSPDSKQDLGLNLEIDWDLISVCEVFPSDALASSQSPKD